MSATTQCPHSDLHFHLNNACIGDTNIHYLEITARCNICQADMEFRGMPWGSSPHQPTMSPDGKEARIPFTGAGEEVTGKPIAAIIRMRPS